MARFSFAVVAFVAIGATSALAETPGITFEVERVPFTSTPETQPIDAAPSDPSIATPVVAYQHFRALQLVASPGAGNIWAEDVHLTTGGDLRRVMIGYFMNLGFSAQATLWVYASDPEDTQAPTDLLLGPIEFNMIGSDVVYTRQVINFNEPNIVRVPKDLWIAVSFSEDNPGLVVVEGEAQVGATHNIHYDFQARGTRQLDPASNFVAEVRVDPVPTSVQATTWSEIKALFAAPTGTRPSN